MRAQGLSKRMGEAERALGVEEPEWVRASRAEMIHWLANVDGAAELYAEYLELLEAEGSHPALLRLERGREITFAVLDSLNAMDNMDGYAIERSSSVVVL